MPTLRGLVTVENICVFAAVFHGYVVQQGPDDYIIAAKFRIAERFLKYLTFQPNVLT